MAEQLPMIRPRWSAYRSKPGVPMGATSEDITALGWRDFVQAVRAAEYFTGVLCARIKRTLVGKDGDAKKEDSIYIKIEKR